MPRVKKPSIKAAEPPAAAMIGSPATDDDVPSDSATVLHLREIANLVGITTDELQVLCNGRQVPAPLGVDRRGPFWDPETIASWIQSRGGSQ